MATTTSTTSTTSSASSLGSSIITSLDVGSGIDTDSLVTKLTAAQKASLEDPITAKQTANAAQVSSAASIASDIAGFSSSLDTLISGGTLMTQPNSSTTGVVTATALAGSRLSNLSASVTVSSLATAQAIKAGVSGFPTTADGSFAITTGGATKSIVVPAGTTLAGFVGLINASGTGVTASTLTSGSTTTLVLKGKTGTDNAFSVSGGGDAALSALAYDPAATGGNTMTASSSAANAELIVDGVAISRASNTITDAVDGVSLVLTAPGTTTLSATRPTTAIISAVTDFVSAYNALKSELDAATAAATSTTAAGALRGNATIREMQRQLSKLTTTPLTASGSITTLAQIGVKTGQDGTLSVDSPTLSKILSGYPDEVEAMFNPAQTSSATGVSITSKLGKVAAGTYSLTGITAASGGAAATGMLDGAAMTASGSTLSAPAGSNAAGLTVGIASGAPSSATLTIDLGLGGALALIKEALTGTSGSITSLQSRLKTQGNTLADALEAAEKKVTVYHDRLVTQFSSMNTRVSAYKATQSYLTQQIDLWTKSTS